MPASGERSAGTSVVAASVASNEVDTVNTAAAAVESPAKEYDKSAVTDEDEYADDFPEEEYDEDDFNEDDDDDSD